MVQNAHYMLLNMKQDENAQLYCIHVITSVPYGIAYAPAMEEYFKVHEQKVQSWFDKVRDMAKNECIHDLKRDFHGCQFSN